MANARTDTPAPKAPRADWLTLLLAIALMVAGTVYPLLMADAQGKADHAVATTLFWSMSAGFVRGVGFIPRHWLPRWLLGAPAAWSALALAVALKAMG